MGVKLQIFNLNSVKIGDKGRQNVGNRLDALRFDFDFAPEKIFVMEWNPNQFHCVTFSFSIIETI